MTASKRPGSDEATEVSGDESAPASRGLSLRVMLAGGIATFDLPAKGELVLGRGSSADAVIDDKSVSRAHAKLVIDGAQVKVMDLGSGNGSRVGGRVLRPNVPESVAPGDVIKLGDVVVVLQRGRMAPRRVPDRAQATAPAGAALLEIERVVERVAPGLINVLIVGETGAGKERIAEAIHARSPRASKPFVRLNCAAVSEHLLESEWFGYERGAFTGAVAPKPGLLESANGGTVLLDEVGELPLGLQAKLLRVIEEKMVLRVGSVKPKPLDVRFVAATNRDLEAEIAAGRFRQDLFFRLNGVELRVPPLRARREEIVPLSHAFLEEASAALGRTAPGLAEDAREALLRYDWPGNVRELRNVIERAVLLTRGAEVTASELPPQLFGQRDEGSPKSSGGSLRDAVAETEKQRVLDALAAAAGNQSRAAEMLGISRTTLSSRLDQFGIQRPRKR